MMRLAVSALITSLALAGPAVPQSFEQAVKDNMRLGLRLCLLDAPNFEAWAQAFRDAGYAEQVERSSENSDTTHTFTAPAETASIELYYGEMPDYCSPSTTHMGVAGANAILDEVVPARYPGYVRFVTTGPVDPATGQPAECVRYEDPTNPIGHVVGVGTLDGSAGCVANGTSRFYSSYRV
ncbi:hypothetical protein [Psychromarinibacter sp. S121]|uniref:hypothetical protein n=1 Tax=Psychromarinibacter sp. S121 TaxID=3415127 RepID=UPI003C7A17B1